MCISEGDRVRRPISDRNVANDFVFVIECQVRKNVNGVLGMITNHVGNSVQCVFIDASFDYIKSAFLAIACLCLKIFILILVITLSICVVCSLYLSDSGVNKGSLVTGPPGLARMMHANVAIFPLPAHSDNVTNREVERSSATRSCLTLIITVSPTPRCIAGLSGFLTFSQSRDGPDRYGALKRFDTMPSNPNLQACWNTV
jgi:hypothetical protein